MSDGSQTSEHLDDPRLMQAAQEYLAQLERGQRPDRAGLLARFPDLAGPLAQCLDGLDLVHGAAGCVAPGPGPAPAVPAGDALAGTPLGDFQIVREIGRGGMGVVYEATQLSLGRRVAVKVLPFAATFDARHLQRFRNEAQAAAQLHHSNIVPVYAVGCERGVHFYAMQLIDGQSLAEVIRQVRERAGRPGADAEVVSPVPGGRAAPPSADFCPRPGSGGAARGTECGLSAALSTQRSGRGAEFFRTAAKLIVQAAEAVDHAHQYGIVHRDIKPANLLADTHGRLWVTDFGLAQFRVDGGLTQTGDVLGTLRYMSPEQAYGQRGLIDHRTDVYSLGATLYELVTLEPVFPGRNRQELLRRIAGEDPAPPRQVDPAVPVELETVILKALGKAPAERYGSARELADDLQRYLRHEPIRARRPTLVDRARKWSRRHPSLVAAAAVLLLLCVAGLVVNNRMIAGEKARTEQALARENRRAVEAEERFRQARRAVDLLIEVSEEELASYPHMEGVRKKLLETALDYYQEFIAQQQGNAGVQADLKAGQERMRRILDELAALQGAHRLALVTRPDVQDDLGLTDEQRAEARRVSDRSSRQRLAVLDQGQGLGAEARRRKFYQVAKANEKALAEILSPDQLRRLGQVHLQAQGPLAFHAPEVAQALKLTVAQRQAIRDVKYETMARMLPEPGRHGGKGRPRFEDFLREEVDGILQVLTPAQRAAWREMTGPPFRGSAGFPPPPPGPFPPG